MRNHWRKPRIPTTARLGPEVLAPGRRSARAKGIRNKFASATLKSTGTSSLFRTTRSSRPASTIAIAAAMVTRLAVVMGRQLTAYGAQGAPAPIQSLNLATNSSRGIGTGARPAQDPAELISLG